MEGHIRMGIRQPCMLILNFLLDLEEWELKQNL